MIEFITSQGSFIVLFFLFTVGAIGSLFFCKNDFLANVWNSFFASVGAIWGLMFASFLLITERHLTLVSTIPLPSLFKVSFNIDALSAFFILIISLITLFCSIYGFGYLKHYYKKYNIGAFGFFYNLFILGMLLVVTASNGIFFLIAWEIMSVTSYFLVIYDRRDENNLKAGFLYLVMTHIGTVFIIIALLLLNRVSGSFDFEIIKAASPFIPQAVKNLVFVLALIGFGTKAGIIPFHIWLPGAHPAAPSHVSGLMSGVMIKTGIYMMIRIFLDLLQPVPTWWGLVILVVGSVSALLGVLYALTEHDLKRLLAYHSIENIGIIMLGLGSALTFSSLGLPQLALLGLIAALFHTLNHATFKSLLFLSAGSVINQTNTRNMEEYGGLIKRMPQTAFFFLIGSMAISALPPFNGFFSEWLTFQALFQGLASLDSSIKWIFIAAVGSLTFTGGLALACFVKAFGITFLARPRGHEVLRAKESSPSLLIGMGALASLSLVLGLFSGFIGSSLERVGRNLEIFKNITSFVSTNSNQGLSVGSFSSVSAPIILILLISAIIPVWLVVKYVIYKNQKVTIGATWDCGTDLSPRMEITATGFARSIITIFKGVLKPSIQHEVEYHDAESRYLPKSKEVTLSVTDLYHFYFYEPFSRMIANLSQRVKNIQSGNINTYILYIFITLLVVLFFAK